MSALVHRQVVPVHFGDVDSAGILYFPRIFHFCHVVMEGFFAKAAGISYATLVNVRRIGFPTVKTQAEYHLPVPYGLELTMTLTVRRVGKSSVDLRFRAYGVSEEALRQEVQSTVVCVDMDRFESVPIPDDLRGVLNAHLEAPAAPV